MRRYLSMLAVALLPLAVGVRNAVAAASPSQSAELAFVGSTGCDGDDEGCTDRPEAQRIVGAIRVARNGALSVLPGLSADAETLPVWFAADAAGGCMYITRAAEDDILAVAIAEDGKLEIPGNSWPSGGHNPVHASVVAFGTHKFLVVANYNGPDDTRHDEGASVASFRIGEGCELQPADIVEHHGSSSDPARQNAAHVHSVTPGVGFRKSTVYACDLGTDEIVVYHMGSAGYVGSADGKLVEIGRFKTKAGYGPRHLVMHPAGQFVYVVCEMAQVVLALEIEQDGALSLVQEMSLLHAGDDPVGSKAGEIAMLPDGSAIFVSNRGKINTVTSFNVDERGRLSQKQQVEAPEFPRGMTLAHGGSVLLVAGQSSGEVVSFRVSKQGALRLADRLSEGLPPNPGAFAIVTANVQVDDVEHEEFE